MNRTQQYEQKLRQLMIRPVQKKNELPSQRRTFRQWLPHLLSKLSQNKKR